MKSITFVFLFIFSMNFIFAQAPEKAEDVSPLLIGEEIPEATLKNHKNKKVDLQEITKQKPTILIFYRGGWCPYCNLQLAGIQEVEQELLDLGYQIMAVSPDNVKSLQKTIEKKDLNYTLLSDADMSLAKQFGIAFQAPKKYEKKFGKENTEKLMPVPSVFLIDKKGVIQFEYINPNYKVRLSSALLKAVAKVQIEEK